MDHCKECGTIIPDGKTYCGFCFNSLPLDGDEYSLCPRCGNSEIDGGCNSNCPEYEDWG